MSVNVLASRRVVIDASLVIDLYAAPNDMRASIAEEVLSWINTHIVEAYAPKLLMVEVVGVLARYLSKEDLELAIYLLSTNKNYYHRRYSITKLLK